MRIIAIFLVLLSSVANAGEFKSSDGAKLLCPEATTQLLSETLKRTDTKTGSVSIRQINDIRYGPLSNCFRIEMSDGKLVDVPMATGCIYVFAD
jgi:hypothetical protein